MTPPDLSPEPVGWQFIDSKGTFRLPAPHRTSYLYFPLVNEAGLMSAITPGLHGDVKSGQHAFLTLPVSVEDLHNTRSARNFWVFVEGFGPWSATGNSAAQLARRFDGAEPVTLEAGFLWHKVTRRNVAIGIEAEIINVVPAGAHHAELMKVTLTNVGKWTLRLTPTAAIPIYGRSADDVRGHRHVTSLLHRTACHAHGVLVKPTLSFDERGHTPNRLTYAVLGAEEEGQPPSGFFAVVEDFIGEGGTLEWPEAVVHSLPPRHQPGDTVNGYESLGGLRFADVTLAPGEAKSYILILAILDETEAVDTLLDAYGTAARFEAALECTQAHWQRKLSTLSFHTGDARYDQWLKWVTLQPTLRRLFGNSFLPYHDYGRGGRGWRDLWQDSLALLLVEAGEVGELLFGNFAGVRIDGSNATIIGGQPGEFKADRNNIPRVWMDHGAWPLLSTRLYLDQTGDLAFLLREQAYFKDHLTHRARQLDDDWHPALGTLLRTASGGVYRGSVLEHLLVQHLTAFFHVGEHNIILLEGADWNDGLDMARTRGESVAFTALYASNLRQLGELALKLEHSGVRHVELAAELVPLLDALNAPLDYNSVEAKRRRLADYFENCRHVLSGAKVRVNLQDLARDLGAKAEWLVAHLRAQEWVRSAEGYGWFNGYYDEQGQRVEGDHPNGVRMTLTGQVFPLMSGLATDEQALAIVRAADRYLFDERVGGYRLNTDFGEVLLSLGRCFGFAFGHKENGAMFSHMAVMFANALYRRGLAQAGYGVLDGLYRHSQNFAISRMYPGLPEYVSARGRGMYPYLTGSASWYLLTLTTEVFGVKGAWGDLRLSPKLVAAQFDEAGQASLEAVFAGRRLHVIYHNPARLDYGAYHIQSVQIDERDVAYQREGEAVTLARAVLQALAADRLHRVEVRLSR
jgi:cellobiose phosphorylase